MKINFPSLFQTSLNKYNIFFIFGNDLIVFERAISFVQKKLSSPLHIKTEEDLLAHSTPQPSLFEDKTKGPSLTLVSQVTDKILKAVDLMRNDHFILTSDKARAQSKLVTHFSQSSTSLAIAAYASPLTTSEFEFLVRDVNLPASTKNILFKAYQNDYMGLLSVLEKIKLYGDVSEAQVSFFLESFSSSDELAPLIHAFLSKEKEKAILTLSRVTTFDLIPLLRNLSRSFQTLFELMPFKGSSKPISWQALSSPVFFKDQSLYQIALSRWRSEEVQVVLETLLDLERQVKFSGVISSQMQNKLLAFLYPHPPLRGR
jgi:DNA polymerase III delta subunit